MKEFEKTQVVFGSIKTPHEVLGEARFEVHLNPVDTSNLHADVFSLDGSFGPKFAQKAMLNGVAVESAGHRGIVSFQGTTKSAQIGGGSDIVGTINIESFTEETRLNDNPITICSFTYFLTDSQIFPRKVIRQLNSQRGLLIGYDDWSKENEPVWRSDERVYPTEIGELSFYPGLTFAQPDEGIVIAKDQLIVNIRVIGEEIAVNEKQQKAEEILSHYLHIMSLLENRFIEWCYCRVDARGESGKGLVREVYKWIPARKYNSNSTHFRTSSKKYQDLIPILVQKYFHENLVEKSDLDIAVRQMLIGTQPNQSLDNQLIYWHSCLDILIKIIAGEKMKERRYLGFSRNLVLACEDKAIEYGDLYPYVSRDDIFSDEKKANFRLTTYRNNMIHYGIYPRDEEYNEVHAECCRAAALFERMIKSILCVRGDTLLGEYRGFR